MAYGNVRREAYTAGGEASQLSLDILNVGAFIFQTVGAAPEAPRWRGATDRPGSVVSLVFSAQAGRFVPNSFGCGFQ